MMGITTTARPAVRPFKNGTGYAKRTQLYPGSCRLCGAGFVGSRDRSYCGDECRRDARRARQEQEKLTGTPRRLISWMQLRFAALERDRFRCVYCGRGTARGAVLEVDHILPRSRGGASELANLATCCRDCNIGKGASVIVVGMLSAAA